MKQEKLPKNKLQLRNQLLFLPFSISLTRYFFEILQDNHMLIYYDDNTDSSNFYIPLKNYNGKWWYAIQVMSEKISDGDAWVIDIQLEHRNKTNDSVISSNQKNNAIKAVFLTNIL